MSSLRSCTVLHLIEDLEALHALQAHSEHCSVQVEFKSTADPSKSVVLSSGSCSFTGSNLMTKDSKENSPNVVSASATKYTLELFGTFWHFWALCITLHIFAHLCTRWCREHWWTLAHQIASCGRLLPAFTWCGKPGAGGLVPCRSLSQLFWLDVAWTMSIDSEFFWRSVATVFLSVAFGLIPIGPCRAFSRRSSRSEAFSRESCTRPSQELRWDFCRRKPWKTNRNLSLSQVVSWILTDMTGL